MEIEMKDVQSLRIKSIGYDKKNRVLRVEFLSNGAVYDYSGVPIDIFNQMLMAESKGRFFGSYIAKEYPYIKVVKEIK